MTQAPWLERRACAADLDALCRLEATAEQGAWSPGQLAESLARHQVRVALDGVAIVGYLAFRVVLDEAEVLNVRVAPAYRRRGGGGCLMAGCLAGLGGIRSLHLEVRAGNQAALALYRKWGFTQVGIRRGYYPTTEGGREDALLWCLEPVRPGGGSTGGGPVCKGAAGRK